MDRIASTLKKLNDAPFSLSNSAALHAVDPASGVFVVTNEEDNTYWEYDVSGDRWTQITNMQNPPAEDHDFTTFQFRFSGCRVILYVRHHHEFRRAYLYRHSL
jgi:hypothetical protein